MKLLVLPDEAFSCRSCTNCCRHWHVELLADDIMRIEKLRWPDSDPLRNREVFFRHSGKTYLAHRPDGACVFLNDSNGYCRIHETFGATIKPLGCQLYPFQIVPTFDNEATVTARYDCPTVRRNEGAPHADSLPQLRQYAGQLAARKQLADPFDETTCCYLDREQIEAITEFVGTLSNAFPRDDQRALFIVYFCDWLALQAADELDRPALGGAFVAIREQVEAAFAKPVERPGLVHRFAFRTLLGLYLRRDEDVLDGRAGRFGRLISMLAFVLGFGSFRGLGQLHPAGRIRKAKLFRSPKGPIVPAENPALRRLIKAKIESFQFMGSAARGRNLLVGLRSLALLYPLVTAAAKYRAANRGATEVDATDIDYAIAAIEYGFGRAAVLAQPFALSLERSVLENNAFTRIVRSI